jgi:hypothetical protein
VPRSRSQIRRAMDEVRILFRTIIRPYPGLAARKYVTEYIGTFFLMFAAGIAALGGAAGGPLAWPTIWVYVPAKLTAGLAARLAFLALNPRGT